jgi:endonuclease YncB( thermonuclease family)
MMTTTLRPLRACALMSAFALLSAGAVRQCISMDAHGAATVAQPLGTLSQVLLPGGYHIGTVRYVVDGDTVAVQVAQSQWTRRVGLRVQGIDAPEVHKINAKCAAEVERGAQAKAYAQQLMPPGTVVRFYPARARDKYGRILARVVPPGGSELAHPIWCG